MPSYLPVIGTLEDVVQSKEYSFVVQKYAVIWGNMMVRNIFIVSSLT